MPWVWLGLTVALALFLACVFVNWILSKEGKPK